jgi:hypothetical protein
MRHLRIGNTNRMTWTPREYGALRRYAGTGATGSEPYMASVNGPLPARRAVRKKCLRERYEQRCKFACTCVIRRREDCLGDHARACALDLGGVTDRVTTRSLSVPPLNNPGRSAGRATSKAEPAHAGVPVDVVGLERFAANISSSLSRFAFCGVGRPIRCGCVGVVFHACGALLRMAGPHANPGKHTGRAGNPPSTRKRTAIDQRERQCSALTLTHKQLKSSKNPFRDIEQ